MKRIKISKGHNLSIQGVPSTLVADTKDPEKISFHPSSIKNFKTKLLVKEGDYVKVGTPIFFNKKNEKVLFVSSCSGTIDSISFGHRRSVESIDINNDLKYEQEDHSDDISRENLLKSGLWTFIRQKPFSKIPHYSSSPKSIFISAMPTEPFAIDYEDLFGYCENYLQDGINALKFIFKCDIYFSSFDNSSVFKELKKVNHYAFNNLHPAGNIGVQIHHINPIKNADDCRWYLSLQDLNRIGEFFTTGHYPNYKFINLGGNALKSPSLKKSLIGTKVVDLVNDVDSKDCIISGDVLSGKITKLNYSLNYHDEILSVLRTNDKREFLGWLMPGFKKYSLTNLFFSKLISNRKSDLSTNKNGSVRTIVPVGNWDKVMPMNILSEYLVKSIISEDIEMMEKLGIYECSPEDFALCAFICQSKVEVSKIIEDGLDIMEADLL